MPLKPAIIRKFVHDTLKPVDTTAQFLEVLSINPELLRENPQTLKTFIESLGSVGKCLADLRILAICEQPEEHQWTTTDLRKLVIEHTARLKTKASCGVNVGGPPIAVRVMEGLLPYAFNNAAYFADHFGNRLSKLILTDTVADGRPGARIVYEIETADELEPEFSACEPFFPLSKTTLSLKFNTGFILCAMKAIIELHHGTFVCAAAGSHATIEMLLPVVLSTEPPQS